MKDISPPTSPLVAEPVDCGLILDAFLAEMDELDKQQQLADSEHTVVTTADMKRRSSTKSTKPRNKPNLSWLRRKQELQSLRSQTQAMETHVAFLTLIRSRERPLESDQKKWKTAALLTKRRLQAARDENALLKDRLQTYLRTSEALQTALATSDAQCLEQTAYNAVAAKALRVEKRTGQLLRLHSSIIFNMLEDSVNARSSELHGISRGFQHPVTSADSEQVRICHDNGRSSAAAVDFQRDRLLPFSAETTSGAVWAVTKLDSIPNERFVQVARSSKDVMAFKGYRTISLERGGTVDIVAYILLKRHVVPGGLIVLTESTTEWSPRLTSSLTPGIATHDSGWMMVRPYPTSGTAPPACQLKIEMHLSRGSMTSSASQEVTSLPTHTVSDVILPSLREIMNVRHQVLDNVLLDAARSAATASA